MGHVVLVTGVARPLGRRLAALLQSAPDVERIIGVDVVPPSPPIGADGRVEFVRADIRNPVIGKVLAAGDVDTVVHLSVVTAPRGNARRSAMKEINVIGTMQLLAACQKAPSVRRLVVKSSTSVYGCSARDPALFTEDMEPQETPRSGYAKDAVEVEGYVRGFARRRPNVGVTTLRMATVLSSDADSEFASYFALPVLPTVLGFDPRLQFLHEEDALEALRRSVLESHLGTYNVAGDGVLLLSQAARRLGKPTLPVPTRALGLAGMLLRQAGGTDISVEQLQLLTFGRGVDTARLHETFGWAPARTTAAAFDDFAATHRVGGPITRERVAVVETAMQEAVA
ncbi:MAG TPA: NAD-dependent epimerase/dehydratase family protein, partial [Actinomycetes bacterium]|nr:NAD-dependent epimerase/dehydratase family protein [Actinomycetes bacterium]